MSACYNTQEKIFVVDHKTNKNQAPCMSKIRKSIEKTMREQNYQDELKIQRRLKKDDNAAGHDQNRAISD